MGFLKRLLSVAGKSSKPKRQRQEEERQPPRVPLDEELAEATIHTILRNNASKYAVIAQTDYLSPSSSQTDTLSPPGTISSHGARSPSPTTSLASAAPSAAHSGTYSVTIRERTVHTPAIGLGIATASSSVSSKRTIANEDYQPHNGTPPKRAKLSHDPDEIAPDSDMSIAPFERSCVRDLRRDSNINALFQLYDEHGHIDSVNFESPEKVGRPQTKRSGSTLRKLLGVDELTNGSNATLEGDISWAERILSEGIVDPSRRFSAGSMEHTTQITMDTGADLTRISTRDSTVDFPPLSSMVVELSTSSNAVPPYRADPMPAPSPTRTPARTPAKSLGTPNRTAANRTTDESPIKPAAEVFAFLLEPRKPKSSTATLPSAPNDDAPNDDAPAVPPKSRASLAQDLPLVPIRTGSSGIPRHPYFGPGAPRPPAAQQGRNRSHSASAADVLAQSPAHRRSATTVATPSRIPRGPRPVSGAVDMRRAESETGRPLSPEERKRPATALGFDETFGAGDADTDEEEDATVSPSVRPTSRIPVFAGGATAKTHTTPGLVRASSVGPATALWAASPRESDIVRASSVGPSSLLGTTPSKSTNRPPLGLMRASSVGPSSLLTSPSNPSDETHIPKIVRASSVGPTAALNVKSPKKNGTRAHRSSSVGASSALDFAKAILKPGGHIGHRRTSSAADTSVMTDAPELAEVQRAVKGTRLWALRPEARRLPAPLPLPPPGRHGRGKENDGVVPRAAARAVSPALGGRVENTRVPSPASSMDLSPFGKDLMANIREERMRVREAGERARSKTPVFG